MNLFAILAIAGAGLACLAAAGLRWRGRPAGAALAAGFVLLTGGVLLAAIGSERDLLYGAIALWAAFGALLFVIRSLAAPTPWLLALPAGAVALMVALAALLGPPPAEDHAASALVVAHAGFQLAHLAALLVAAGAALCWILASAALKRASPGALRLPALPTLERIALRFAAAAAALLIAGIALGGVAMAGSTRVTPTHPAVACAVAALVVLCLALVMFQVRVWTRRAFHIALLIATVPSVAGALMLVVGRHG